MKMIYLTKNQIKKINDDQMVVVSRNGRKYAISSKRSKTLIEKSQVEIKLLEQRLRELKNGLPNSYHNPPMPESYKADLTCKDCGKRFKNKRGCSMHRRIVHGGLKSNIAIWQENRKQKTGESQWN